MNFLLTSKYFLHISFPLVPNNMSSNDLMHIMNAMASGFNMNPPPPPPIRMGCGDLRAHHAGMFVELTGRLIKKRVTRFMELRDRGNSACQLVILEDRVSSLQISYTF